MGVVVLLRYGDIIVMQGDSTYEKHVTDSVAIWAGPGQMILPFSNLTGRRLIVRFPRNLRQHFLIRIRSATHFAAIQTLTPQNQV